MSITKQKFTSTIAGASIFVTLFSLLSRGLGFIREMMFASYFGLETEFDLYLVGGILPVTINFIILYIGQNYFIPNFQKINSVDTQKFFSHTFYIFITGGIAISVILLLVNEPIMHLYLGSASIEEMRTANTIFRVMLVTIPFSAGISILTAFLQSKNEFKYPSISILLLNISILILIFVFTNRIGVFIIPIGYVIGTVIQFCYLWLKSFKFSNYKLEFNFSSYLQLKSTISSTFLIIILIESLSQLYSVSDRYFYGNISPGGIASMNYAMLIFSLPILTISLSLSTVIFPKLSYSISNELKSDIKKLFNDNVTMNIFIFMPIAFIFYFFGDVVIKLAFERGKFLEESTSITFGVLKCYAISLVFYALYAILNKIFYSLNLVKLLLSITIVGICLKVTSNFLFVNEYQQNGLAISTSLCYIFYFFGCYFILISRLKIKNNFLIIREFVFYLLNCLFSFIIINILSNIISDDNYTSQIGIILLFILFYIGNLFVIKPRSINILNQVLQRLNLRSINQFG